MRQLSDHDEAYFLTVLICILCALAVLLVLILGNAHAQLHLSTPSPLYMDAPRGVMHSTTSVTLANDGDKDLRVDSVTVDDTADVTWWGIVSPLPAHEQRRMVIAAKRYLGHDTTVRVFVYANDAYPWHDVAVTCVAGTTGVCDHLPESRKMVRWWTILGQPCDSTTRGIVFGNGRIKFNIN